MPPARGDTQPIDFDTEEGPAKAGPFSQRASQRWDAAERPQESRATLAVPGVSGSSPGHPRGRPVPYARYPRPVRRSLGADARRVSFIRRALIMETVWEELTSGLGDGGHVIRVAVRLIVAMLLGAVVGIERERAGQWAGLRTHMLVALGSALLVVIPSEAGLGLSDITRVIQGIATGIGFIGAGSVLKLADSREIQGLTTAAGVWVTAAVGVAAGLGFAGVAALSVALAWVILTAVGRLEARFIRRRKPTTSHAGAREDARADAAER